MFKALEEIFKRLKILNEQLEHYRNEFDRCDANDPYGQLYNAQQITEVLQEIVTMENFRSHLMKKEGE